MGTAQQYAEQAASMEQIGLGLTDHGTMSGALHHITACRNKDLSGKPVREGDPIIPITGVEAYFRPDRSLRDKEKRRAWHLCLFAKNLRGWHSLLRITSIAYGDQEEGGGFYQYPCVDWDLLEQYSEGLICSTACISGYLCDQIKLGDDKEADRYLKRMKKIFGDDLWLEIMPHDFAEQRMVNVEIANLATDHSLPIIATTDAHYPYKDWAKTQQVAKLMSTASSYKKEKTRQEKDESPDEGFAKLLPSAYLMDECDVRDLFEEAHPDLPEHVVDESIRNTYELMRSTTPFLLDRQNKLPRISDDEEDAERILNEWMDEGLKRIKKTKDKRYIERREYEMSVLKKNGVFDYFVLTGTVVRWARAQGILVNVRGSAAGCLVSYLIGITSIDPIGWGLLFERFLNPDRKGLPDIDLDFQHDRRDEVKQFVIDEFGQDHVADIISHSTFQPKAVIESVARTFDVPYADVKELNKTIDIRADDEETTLEQLRPINEKLDEFADKYPEVWKHALRLEGTVANASKHAAGVVITDKPITDYLPLERGKKGDLVTSWSDRADFPAVSDHGLVKLDMLGIKGLTKQAVALDLIKKRHNELIDLNALGVMTDPTDVDPEVMEIFNQGLTLGIWQFGGRGISNLLKQIKPDHAGDLCAANALYRPGPMGKGLTWDYAERKKHPDEIDYWHPMIQPVLEETYAIIAYQEQVMEVCKALGNFSGGQADSMRKAMGKLYRLPGDAAQQFMQGFKDTWDAGIEANGIDLEVAQQIWEMILSFGGYGFNKSHSASYAVQAYQDAYLKCYYPHEFFCALLMHPPSKTQSKAEEKARFMQQVFREAEVLGVEITAPDINTSDDHFSLDGQLLRYGLMAIKEVGVAAAQEIKNKRPFDDFDDFTEKVEKRACNAKVRKALIESGACDRWNMRDDLSGREMATLEKQRLGVTLTMSGEADTYKDLIAENIFTTDEIEDDNEVAEGDDVLVIGEVIETSTTTIKKKGSKQFGEEMCFVTLSFGVNQWRCTFFPENWARYKDLVTEGSIAVAGHKDTFKGTTSIVVEHAKSIEQWVAEDIEGESEK